jgi:O-antigen ligase
MLLAGELGLGIIILAGPADGPNRLAGLTSLGFTMIVSGFVATAGRAREYKLGLLSCTTVFIAAMALPSADPVGIRSPLAQGAATVFAIGFREHAVPRHLVGLAAGVPTLFLVALTGYKRHLRWLRVLWLGMAITGGLIVLASDSRVAWVAVAAGCVSLVVPAVVGSRAIAGLAALAAVVCAGFAVGHWLGGDVSLIGREQLWRLGLHRVTASPLLGLGFGGLAAVYREELPEVGTNAHNLVIQTLGDFGLAGLVVVLSLMVWSCAAAFSPHLPQATFAGFLASFVYLVVAGMAESIVDATQTFATTSITIVLPLMFAVLAVPLSTSQGRREVTSKSEPITALRSP